MLARCSETRRVGPWRRRSSSTAVMSWWTPTTRVSTPWPRSTFGERCWIAIRTSRGSIDNRRPRPRSTKRCELDLAGKIIIGKDGRPTYNIGKAKGTAVVDDPGFGYWMLGKDFTANTKMHLEKILEPETSNLL